mmetsp:Transcript_54439/g.129736  ORF Transcript_54439/g.129736 Transcript_54439/m.129736 type:complete len:145 (+) Transcript_54439:402-836(+)
MKVNAGHVHGTSLRAVADQANAAATAISAPSRTSTDTATLAGSCEPVCGVLAKQCMELGGWFLRYRWGTCMVVARRCSQGFHSHFEPIMRSTATFVAFLASSAALDPEAERLEASISLLIICHEQKASTAHSRSPATLIAKGTL